MNDNQIIEAIQDAVNFTLDIVYDATKRLPATGSATRAQWQAALKAEVLAKRSGSFPKTLS